MSIIKKFNKKKKTKFNGKLLGMKRVLVSISEKSLGLVLAAKFPDLKKVNDKNMYDFLHHVSLTIHDELSKDSEAIMLLSETVYTDGHSDSVNIDNEKIGAYTKYLFDYLTTEKLEELLDNFNAGEERVRLIIDGSKVEAEELVGETTIETI